MTTSEPVPLAVELHPHTPTHWSATYYPMVTTPAGRWADVTWPLHQHRLPTTPHLPDPARQLEAQWLEARSPDPDHPCYTTHRTWATHLAAGYATARTTYDTEAEQAPLHPQQAQQPHDTTVVIPAGQLTEWVLDDLQEHTTDAHG